MEQNIFDRDEALERAMLESCLLFDKRKKTGKRELLLPKKILSHRLKGDFTTIDGAISFMKNRQHFDIDEIQIKNAIKNLSDNNFLELKDNGDLILTEQRKNESQAYVEEFVEKINILVNSIFSNAQSTLSSLNGCKEQAKINIKKCLDYYFAVSSYQILGIDDDIDFDHLPNLEEIASNHINNKEQVEQILYAIGNVVAKPDKEQKEILELMARIVIISRLMGLDPLLNNFKQSIIGRKVFILDTDFILYAITDCGTKSMQYRNLLKQLIECGCNIYIPQEVMTEVYDHAEAARKRYIFASVQIGNAGNNTWANYNIKNVFVKSYYCELEKKTDLVWNRYIGNYHNKEYGEKYTYDVIKSKLGNNKNIKYGNMPYNANIFSNSSKDDIALRDTLWQSVLEETHKTEKAEMRDEEKNERIAKTDTMLFLTTKMLNEYEKKREEDYRDRNDLLQSKYYVLTNSTRVYYCALNLKVKAKVLCSPSALIAYLIESGIMRHEKIDMLSLLENPFLAYIAERSWDDAKKMIEVGIDFKNKNIVSLRYELQADVQSLLTAEFDSDEYKQAYEDVKDKGYSFVPHVSQAIEREKAAQAILAEKEKEIEKLKERVEKQDKQLRKEKYQDRLKKNKNKHK